MKADCLLKEPARGKNVHNIVQYYSTIHSVSKSKGISLQFYNF